MRRSASLIRSSPVSMSRILATDTGVPSVSVPVTRSRASVNCGIVWAKSITCWENSSTPWACMRNRMNTEGAAMGSSGHQELADCRVGDDVRDEFVHLGETLDGDGVAAEDEGDDAEVSALAEILVDLKGCLTDCAVLREERDVCAGRRSCAQYAAGGEDECEDDEDNDRDPRFRGYDRAESVENDAHATGLYLKAGYCLRADQCVYGGKWWARRESNPRPIGYEPTALTPELRARRVWVVRYFSNSAPFASA